METIIENRFLKLDFDQETDCLISIWQTINDMRDSDYRKLFLKYYEAVKNLKPSNILVNAFNAQFAISVETQQWINELVFPLYKALKVEKMAIVMSENFIAQLSFEQAAEEVGVPEMQIEYFVSQEKALSWIKGE